MGEEPGDGSNAPGAGFSRHPTDRLIRELIRARRAAIVAEVALIIDRMATAPFDPRLRKVRVKERGIPYRGRRVAAHEDSLFHHLVKRVLIEQQWADGTTEDQYLVDLRRAVRSAVARLVVYNDRDGPLAATISPTAAVVPTERQGVNPLPNLLVVYSADRGVLITGYQFSSLAHVRLPEEVVWLK